MKSTERRKQLISWLNKEGTLSLPQMISHFGVSKMTIHRDLNWLEEQKALKRIHGGACRIEQQRAVEKSDSTEDLTRMKCLVCSRPSSQNLLYILTLKNGERRVACCPHCGISAHLMMEDQIAMALTADFLTGRLHSAQHSYFSMGSAVDHCCRPSILTFDDKEMALRFQQGFGGEIGTFADALDFLRKDISIHSGEGCPHCAPLATFPK